MNLDNMPYRTGVNIGGRVELCPASDLWMRGAKYGTVLDVKDGIATVRMDHPQVKRPVRVKIEDIRGV